MNLYYYIVLVSLIYFLIKYGRLGFTYVVVIFLFYDGLFAFYGTTTWNIYKVILPLAVTFLYLNTKGHKNFIYNQKVSITGVFILFSIAFIFIGVIHNDKLTMVFNQYSKYYLYYFYLLILYKISVFNPQKFSYIGKLVFEILFVQGILAVIKYNTMGVVESIIGTVSYIGGAAGTVLPLLGIIFIWIYKDGVLSKKDWLVFILLLFIGFGSMKRAVWFIAPIILFILNFYISRQRFYKKYLYGLLLIPVVFYLGVRLNPTLNPDYTYWGSFDINFVLDYTMEYSFGGSDSEKGTGRGGAFLLLTEKILSMDYSFSDLFGQGLNFYYGTDSELFDELDFGISHKGAATGFFQDYLTIGIIGMLLSLLFIYKSMTLIKNNRFRYLLLGFYFWEYFLYTGISIKSHALGFIFAYLIFYSNQFGTTSQIARKPSKKFERNTYS